jgi:hypothetical protein
MTDDDQLRRLLSDAVSDIEPHDRLAQIRDSVRSDPKVVPMSRPRPWIAVVGVAAAVAVIGGVAFAAGALSGSNNADDHTPTGPGPTSHHTTAPVTPPTSSPTTTDPTTPSGTKAYAVYYVGDNPSGKPVLFREFHSGAGATSNADLAVADLASLPLDPDYRTPWHPGDLTAITLDSGAGVIDVALGSSAVHDRPAGMSAGYARAALQQVVYTAQASFGKRLGVQFTWHGNPIDQVFGEPTSEPLAQANPVKVCSLVNISSPNDGQQVSGQLTVTGVNNAFEGTSVIYLERDGKKYLTTPVIGGFGPDKLYPWTASLAVSTIPPGEYTLVAENDDPSGQGNPAQDTRVLEVK